MSHAAALDRLMALGGELVTAPGQPRRKFDLAHMRALLDKLGNPQQRFPSILIAGTNGKGSTSATLASILTAAGYTAGLYTSPHLSVVNERIQIGGALLDDAALFSNLARVEEAAAALVTTGALPGPPSFFETMTAIAMLAFAHPPSGRPIDIAVLEVGMGGRLDATNVVEPLLSVITDISLDHTEWLGLTITAIAREKAGILRPGGTMVTLPQHPEANQALGEVAVSLGVRGVNAAEYLPGRQASASPTNRYSLTVAGEPLQVDSPLRGQHQQRNLALAIAAALELRNLHGYNIDLAAISRGIYETVWPGRLEILEPAATAPGRPTVLLDVAHNPAAAWALRAALRDVEATGLRLLIFGCMRDKAVSEIAQILFPVFDHIWLLELPSPRSASFADLTAAAEQTGTSYSTAPDIAAALEDSTKYVAAERSAGGSPDAGRGLIVGSGSVLLVGALRELLG